MTKETPDIAEEISDFVFINENDQVEMILKGDLVNEQLLPMLNETVKCLNQVRKKNKPHLLLVEVTHLNKISIYSRKTGTDWIRSRKELSIAVYGNNLFMKYFVHMLITATNRSCNMKFFTTKKEAQEWLTDFCTLS